MASNSSFEVNQYSRPCCSCPRGLRVVCDTDTCKRESSSSKALTKLDLPVPLGAETTNKLPGNPYLPPWVDSTRYRPSFNVLNLFTHLLDEHLHLNRDLREFQRSSLRPRVLASRCNS